jgi:D-glycero-D-manno-heptose 1,7-bisphosphate phosphatase
VNPLPSAVFLDRDGTIIKDVTYLSRPEQVELLPGAAEAIARINAALVPVVVVTNQSGVGRGYFSIADYERTERRMNELLAERGAHIDATYYCPHRPDENCACRKPGSLLFEQAAADLGFDLSKALLIGDRLRDIEPGMSSGATLVLVPTRTTPGDEVERATETARVAESLGEAIDWYLCTN